MLIYSASGFHRTGSSSRTFSLFLSSSSSSSSVLIQSSLNVQIPLSLKPSEFDSSQSAIAGSSALQEMAPASICNDHKDRSLTSSPSSSPWYRHRSGFFSTSSPAPEEKVERFLGRLFRRVDENGDGKISPAELRCCLTAVGEEMTEDEAKAMVESADSDGDGLLGMEDFERLVGEEEEEGERRRRMKEAFEMYVGEEGGSITPRSLRRTLSRLGEVKTIQDCRLMIERFDLNGDGVLSFDEFAAMML